MNGAHGFALLVGLFCVPAVLLALGHRLRARSRPLRVVFWGAVAGHTSGIIIATLAFHVPPVLWDGDARVFLAFWATPALAALGAAAGAVVAHRPRARA